MLFSALRHVDLSANSLDAIPPSLCALPKVDTIKLAHNRLTSLYASGGGWVCATPSLAHLDLSSNQLVDLGELPLQLSPERMRTLSLENNALTAVPAALSRLSALGTLGLAGNPQRQVRQGLLEKGTLAIMEYLRTIAADRHCCRRARRPPAPAVARRRRGRRSTSLARGSTR